MKAKRFGKIYPYCFLNKKLHKDLSERTKKRIAFLVNWLPNNPPKLLETSSIKIAIEAAHTKKLLKYWMNGM